jgi:PilZ domain-containing protein
MGTNIETAMSENRVDRRRHARFPLGLPVGLRVASRTTPLTVELLDLSESGARFQALDATVRVAERATFGFVVPDRPSCRAEGQVVRADRSGQFVVALDEANDAFVGFVRSL